jgi:hypothetical protein
MAEPDQSFTNGFKQGFDPADIGMVIFQHHQDIHGVIQVYSHIAL